jgi:acylphosphatase
MEINKGITCLHAIVEGHVQGVGFRYFVKENAEALNLTGWVRNRYDGSVELTAQGRRDTLERFMEFIRVGPSRSIVTNVKVDWSNESLDYIQFSFLPTE